MPDRRVLIIHNPAAGRRYAHRLVDRVALGLHRSGRAVELVRTTGPGHASRLAADAVGTGIPLVVAAGGDGTINEVMQPLVGTPVALGVLPVGTVNVWAAETAIPYSEQRLVDLLQSSAARRVDVGLAGGRYFLLMASLGLDAAVVQSVPLSLKRLIGRSAYAVTLSRLLRSYAGTPVSLLLDGRVFPTTLLMMVVGNTRRYAGSLRATPHAIADDGKLDVFAIRGDHVWRSLAQTGAFFSRQPALRRRALHGRAATIEVISDQPIPVQVDGDFLGHTPMRIEARPGALWVIVGPGNAGGLFAAHSE